MTADASQAPSTNRRRHPRHTLPLTVLIGATPYVVTDWSEGGVRLRDYGGLLDTPSTTQMRVLLPAGAVAGVFASAARVVWRYAQTGDLALEFAPLGPLARHSLTRYIDNQEANGRA